MTRAANVALLPHDGGEEEKVAARVGAEMRAHFRGRRPKMSLTRCSLDHDISRHLPGALSSARSARRHLCAIKEGAPDRAFGGNKLSATLCLQQVALTSRRRSGLTGAAGGRELPIGSCRLEFHTNRDDDRDESSLPARQLGTPAAGRAQSTQHIRPRPAEIDTPSASHTGQEVWRVENGSGREAAKSNCRPSRSASATQVQPCRHH